MENSMNELSHLWAGNIYGTNTGKVFLELAKDETGIKGKLRVNDDSQGIYVYLITAELENGSFKIGGLPETGLVEGEFGELSANLKLLGDGNLKGRWETTIGTGGTIHLSPHEKPSSRTENAIRFHTNRHVFSAVRISARDILEIADSFQSEFDGSKVVITVDCGTEISYFLEDFKAKSFGDLKADFLKIQIQQPEGNGISRMLSVQFGEVENVAIAQSADETWAIGRIEKLAREIEHVESKINKRFGNVGDWVNSLIFFAALVVLPDIESILWRAIFLGGVFAILAGSLLLRRKYVSNATIYLGDKKIGYIEKNTPNVITWISTIGAGVLTAALISYFKLN